MLDCVSHNSIHIVHDYEYSTQMKNIPCPGEIIREDITVVADADKSKVANHLAHARALRSDLGDIKFDANDIDAFKRNGRIE